MLRLAILFAVIALVAAGLGFYGLSDVSASFAKFFALLFAVLFVVAPDRGSAASSADQVRSSDTTARPRKDQKAECESAELIRPFEQGPV